VNFFFRAALFLIKVFVFVDYAVSQLMFNFSTFYCSSTLAGRDELNFVFESIFAQNVLNRT
jgi:hypothetical protein